jgi:hypothetical protein
MRPTSSLSTRRRVRRACRVRCWAPLPPIGTTFATLPRPSLCCYESCAGQITDPLSDLAVTEITVRCLATQAVARLRRCPLAVRGAPRGSPCPSACGACGPTPAPGRPDPGRRPATAPARLGIAGARRAARRYTGACMSAMVRSLRMGDARNQMAHSAPPTPAMIRLGRMPRAVPVKPPTSAPIGRTP